MLVILVAAALVLGLHLEITVCRTGRALVTFDRAAG